VIICGGRELLARPCECANRAVIVMFDWRYVAWHLALLPIHTWTVHRTPNLRSAKFWFWNMQRSVGGAWSARRADVRTDRHSSLLRWVSGWLWLCTGQRHSRKSSAIPVDF